MFDEQRLEANRKPCRNSQRTNQRQVIAKYQRLPVNEDEDPKHTDGSDGLANTLWHVLPGRPVDEAEFMQNLSGFVKDIKGIRYMMNIG